jgi:hypothetical protein
VPVTRVRHTAWARCGRARGGPRTRGREALTTSGSQHAPGRSSMNSSKLTSWPPRARTSHHRGRFGVPDPELQRRQRLAVGRGGSGRSQVRHTPAAPGFLVKHLGQVMPRPIRFTSNIAIPMVNTNPNVTQREAVECPPRGRVRERGGLPRESTHGQSCDVIDPATPTKTYATTTSACRRALWRPG